MRKYGVLVISHGSRDQEWIKLVRQACADLRLPSELRGVPVECSFLELVDGYYIQDGVDRLEQLNVTDIIIVPLFISSGSTHIDEIAWALGIQEQPQLATDIQRINIRSARIHWCAPMDDSPEIAQLLFEKVKALSVDPSRELVLIIGHGTKEKGFHRHWQSGMLSLAKELKSLGGYAATDIAMLLPDQAACKLKVWQRKRPDLATLIAPLFLSEGYFTNRVIPSRLTGFEYRYNGKTLLPSPHVTKWMERRIINMWKKTETNR